MYKVFFNEKKIRISPPGKITLNKPTHIFDKKCTAFELKNWFVSFAVKDLGEVILVHEEPEKFFEIFKSAFCVINAAGGVVKKKDKILYISRNGKWDLPKGKIDKGETVKQAAIREVKEECGIKKVKIINSLPSTFHIYQSPHNDTFGSWIFKETFWFEMKYDGKKLGKPQLEEGISEVRWFTKMELNEVLNNTYENLKQIILLYLD